MSQHRYTFACLILCAILFNSIKAFAQSECEVLQEELKGEYLGEYKKELAHGKGTATGINKYIGDFKKGLPQGNGIYTWGNGVYYEGKFVKGKKNGEGKMIIPRDDQADSLVVGFWVDDQYIGKYKDGYKVHYKSPVVTKIAISPTDEEKNVLHITISTKGKTESNPKFELKEEIGAYSSIQSFGRTTKVFVVRFPFKFTLNYLGESVDLEILSAGSWNVNIDYNK